MGCQSSYMGEGIGIPKKRKSRIAQVTTQKSITELMNMQNIKKYQHTSSSADVQLIYDVFSKSQVFSCLSQKEKMSLVDCAKCYETAKQEYIFRQGDNGSFLFIIHSGKVRIEFNNFSKSKKLLSRGDIFGDLSLLYTAPRSASAYALEDCKFYCFTYGVIKRTLQEVIKKSYKTAKQYISNINIFEYLSKRQKMALAHHALFLKYEQSEVLFREGEAANCFYVIVEGEAVLNVKGKETIVMKANDSFGQNSFEEGQIRSATATIAQKSKLIAISRSIMHKCLGGSKLQEICFYNIIKWSFKRIEDFQRISAILIEKIIEEAEILELKAGDPICQVGDTLQFMVICLKGKVNQELIGTVFHSQYMRMFPHMRLSSGLRMTTDGAVCLIGFKDIEKILNCPLANLSNHTMILTERQLMIKKDEYLSSLALEDLQIKRILTTDDFSTSYLTEDTNTNYFTLKCMPKASINAYNLNISEEKQMLSQFESPFLGKLYRSFDDANNLYFLLKRTPGKDFFDLLRDIGLVERNLAKFYAANLIYAIELLHSNNIVYRDLKPETIIVDMDGYLQLTDFGAAKVLKEENGYRTFTIIGTPHYMAPQVLEAKGYSFEADLWSLGVILFEMVCGVLPWGEQETDPMKICESIRDEQLEFPEYYKDTPGKDLIKRLLSKDPIERDFKSWHMLKKLPFFQGINWNKLVRRKHEITYMPQLQPSPKSDINQNAAHFLAKKVNQ